MVGRFGDRVFLVGENYDETFDDLDQAELYLMINDELKHEYGAGLRGNSRKLQLEIEVEIDEIPVN